MRFHLVLLLVLLAAGGTAGAQAPDAPQPVPAFEESIDVQAVNLEAVVTDSRGRRVTGLTVEDFKLFVDGAETPITFFSPVEEERQRHIGDIGGVDPSGTPGAGPSWQSRNILVFLDESTMMKARRNLVLRSLTKQIEDLSPGDQMAVVAFSGSGLEVLCDWTADRERLASVLAAVRKRPSDGIRLDVVRREEMNDANFVDVAASLGVYDHNPRGNPFTNPAEGVFGDSPISGLDVEEEGFSGARWQRPPGFRPTQLFNPLNRYLEVGEAAAGAMRGLPAPAGRKMLMLLTEGFHDPVFAQPVIQEAQRLSYSLYPVDVTGIDSFMVQNDVAFDAPQPFRLISSFHDSRINHTLATMAAETGGKAAINSNRLMALERLVEDSSSYYLVGFSPTWRGDDRRHDIELTVSRPGLKVRTRDSYVDASRRTRLALAADASLLLGRSREEQRLIVTADDKASNAGGRKVGLTLGVPVESLAFSPREKGFHAEAPFALVVLDDKGERKHLQEAWVSVDVDKLPLQGTYARFQFAVDAGRRAERIVITVHDALTGEALWGELRLDPQETQRARAAR